MSDSKDSLSLFSEQDGEEMPPTLSIRETAKLLGLHIRTVQKKLKQGELRRASNGQVERASALAYQQEHEHLPKQQTRSRQPRNIAHAPDEQMTVINALRDMMHDTIRQLMIQQRDLIRQIVAEQRTTAREMMAEQRTATREWTREMIGLIREQATEGKTETRQALEAVETERQDLLAALTKRPSRKTTAALPQPGTTIDRIYRHLVEVKRPQRADQVERALNLPGPIRSTRRALDTLVQRGLAERTRPGVYQALAPTGRLPDETGPHLTTLERVYQTIRDADEPIPARDIQRQLDMPREVSAEIARLLQRGRIERIEQEGNLPSRYRVGKKD